MLVTPPASARAVIPFKQTIIHENVRLRAQASRSRRASSRHFIRSVVLLLWTFRFCPRAALGAAYICYCSKKKEW
jgi:hypothetical protein